MVKLWLSWWTSAKPTMPFMVSIVSSTPRQCEISIGNVAVLVVLLTAIPFQG
jgi:hypothetical protein